MRGVTFGDGQGMRRAGAALGRAQQARHRMETRTTRSALACDDSEGGELGSREWERSQADGDRRME